MLKRLWADYRNACLLSLVLLFIGLAFNPYSWVFLAAVLPIGWVLLNKKPAQDDQPSIITKEPETMSELPKELKDLDDEQTEKKLTEELGILKISNVDFSGEDFDYVVPDWWELITVDLPKKLSTRGKVRGYIEKHFGNEAGTKETWKKALKTWAIACKRLNLFPTYLGHCHRAGEDYNRAAEIYMDLYRLSDTQVNRDEHKVYLSYVAGEMHELMKDKDNAILWYERSAEYLDATNSFSSYYASESLRRIRKLKGLSTISNGDSQLTGEYPVNEGGNGREKVIKSHSKDEDDVSVNVGGNGTDIVLSEISQTEFLEFISGDIDNGYQKADELPWIYSNSNPFFSDSTITLSQGDSKKELLLDIDDDRVERSSITPMDLGKFYLLTEYDAKEYEWHWIDSINNFDPKELRIYVEDIIIDVNSSKPSYSLIKNITYGGLDSESRDATNLQNYNQTLIDDKGNSYSIYSTNSTEKNIKNLSFLIEQRAINDLFMMGAYYFRGRLYFETRMNEKAIDDLCKVSTESQYFCLSKLMIGLAQESQGDFMEASLRMTEAIECNAFELCDKDLKGYIYQARGGLNSVLRRPAIALKDYKLAIEFFEGIDDKKIDLAECQFARAVLLDKFTNDPNLQLFCDALNTHPNVIKKMDKEIVNRLLDNNLLSQEVLSQIVTLLLIDKNP